MTMNKILSTALIAVVGFSFVSCDDFLDDNRYPQTSIVNSPIYWNNPENCQMQVNRLYQYFYSYGSGTGLGNFYFNTLSDDQVSSTGGAWVDWKNTSVPTSSTGYSDPYTVIRGCNYMIQGIDGATDLSAAQKANFLAQARMIRGYEYYQLVRKYGDVCWAGTWDGSQLSGDDLLSPDNVLDPESPELMYPRVSRKEIMDLVYDDVYYATQNISTVAAKQAFSQDMAKAMLSDICLWEGTFWKYCTQAENGYAPDQSRSQLFLNRCVEVSQSLVTKYAPSANYQALYNSPWSASGYGTTLSGNTEIIFACEYKQAGFSHSTIAYTASSTQVAGISKDAFDSYLFLDGKPKALTSLDTSDLGVPEASVPEAADQGPGVNISKLLEVRDQRLAATTDPYIYCSGMSWSRAGSMQMTSSSGYGVKKYDNVLMPNNNRVTTGQNFTSAPVYWGSVVALNYAEAKAELGTLTDGDLNNTLNKLYARAGLPSQTVASLSSMNDPANNMGVSSLLWEVRRCRRCELIMDNDYRYWDLNRWHKLDLLDQRAHPNIWLGANVSNVPASYGITTLTEGGYILASNGHAPRRFEGRQYLYPIPSGQLTLNENLKQNPNW